MLAQCGLCELNWAQFCRLTGNAEKNEVWSCEKPRGGGELDHFFGAFHFPFIDAWLNVRKYLIWAHRFSCKVKIIGGGTGCGEIDANENLFLMSMFHKVKNLCLLVSAA